MRLQLRNHYLLVLTAAGVLLWWAAAGWKVRQAEANLAVRELECRQVERAAAAARERLVAIENERQREQLRHAEAVAAAAKASARLERVKPARWTSPPERLPHWDPQSPFVWLQKEMVERARVDVFTETGELRPELGVVMAFTEPQRRRLNQEVQRLLQEYHAHEADRAEPTGEHLASIARHEGPRASIRVGDLSDIRPLFQEQFKQALGQELGEQRSQMLLAIGGAWISRQFGDQRPEGTIISAAQNPDGTFDVSIGGNGGLMHVGRIPALDPYVPRHFHSLLEQAGLRLAESEAAPTNATAAE